MSKVWPSADSSSGPDSVLQCGEVSDVGGLALTVALPEFVDHFALEFVVCWTAPDRFEALLISEVDIGQISQKRLEQGQNVRGINLIRNASYGMTDVQPGTPCLSPPCSGF